MIEERSEEQLRAQLEVSLFGAFRATQAVLPSLRARGRGRIVRVLTIGGIAAFPSLGGL